MLWTVYVPLARPTYLAYGFVSGTLIVVGPLLVAFLLFQRQFVQSFMHAGIK
jgi:hypothetical protein